MRPAPQLLPAALSLVSLALVGATCNTSGSSLPLSQLGLDDLTSEARLHLSEAAGALPAYCGCSNDVASCLAAHPDSRPAQRMVKLMGQMARMGATFPEIISSTQEYYRSFEAAPVTIDLSRAACRGPWNAPVTLVEFSDFECPACGSLKVLLDAIAPLEGDRLRVCFKYFPLQVHPNALAAAQAAELARTQSKFWEIHDLLFDHQEALGAADLGGYFRQAGLDPEALAQALERKTFLEAVQASKADGKRLGVSGTPHVFLNGRPMPLPLTGEFLVHAIDDAAERAGPGRWVCE